MSVKKFILEHWALTVREVKEDTGNHLVLPYPFTVPSEKNYFQEMYYWDTYFTNVGLFSSGLTQQAIYNCENIAYVIDTQGFMSNSTLKGLLAAALNRFEKVEKNGIILTDDKAPVEVLGMKVLDELIARELEGIKNAIKGKSIKELLDMIISGNFKINIIFKFLKAFIIIFKLIREIID